MSISLPAAYSMALPIAPAPVETPSMPPAARTRRAAAATQSLWPQHKTLTISFMDTPKSAEQFIQKQIEQAYSLLINLKLEFVEGIAGDIRISTSPKLQGDWSKIGTDALRTHKNQPTMHLNINTHHSRVAMNALHEFGHAIGLLHEHQHPDRRVDFNLIKTYHLYEKYFGLDTKAIYHNLLKKHDRATTALGNYDSHSIMHYSLSDAVLWKQESSQGYNTTLSDTDKAFIKTLYPPA